MATEKISIPSANIIEENVFSKPKCQAILSLIAHFQHQNKNIQRAHLIQVLVKNPASNSSQKEGVSDNDKKISTLMEPIRTDGRTKNTQNDAPRREIGTIHQKRGFGDVSSKIMFNSIANLDKTIQQLRKLGLITNQFMRGYPRIILTKKGRIVFYSVIYPSIIYQTITELFNNFL